MPIYGSGRFANVNSPSSYEPFVSRIVDLFVIERGLTRPLILDFGGTNAFRTRAASRLPRNTDLRTVNIDPSADPTYRTLAEVPLSFRPNLIMVFGVIEYFRTPDADLFTLLTDFHRRLAPSGVLLISETDPEWPVALVHSIDNALTSILFGKRIEHWNQGDVKELLINTGYHDIKSHPDLVPMALLNRVWVMSAEVH
jgi:hypothetical protein